jgi:hypothetical protein
MKTPVAVQMEMRMDPYQRLAKALAVDGICCRFQTPSQLVVSGQVGLVWPDRGNSFWVTHAGSGWHLFTWSPVGYRVSQYADIAALCRACMAHGDIAMPAVPQHIAQEFGLVELSEEEAEAVYREMDGPAEPSGK